MDIRLTENARSDFLSKIKKSWTWARMTKEEQERFDQFFNESRIKESIRGKYDARIKICNTIYESYLIGLGYNGWLWREPKKEIDPVPLF